MLVRMYECDVKHVKVFIVVAEYMYTTTHTYTKGSGTVNGIKDL